MKTKAIVLFLLGFIPAFAQDIPTSKTEQNMDRIERCKKNYTELFGGEALTGQGTDPEMMDILQKFIFGEVFRTGDEFLENVHHFRICSLSGQCLASE